MAELSGRYPCELCYLPESNSTPIRVYLCLHPCKKMLCIKHLSEHDQYIEKQTEYENKLQHVWNDYIKIFNEDEIQKELQNLKIKLENYQKLREDVNNLLSIDRFDDSMDKNEKFHTTIETVQKAIEQENRSKSMTSGIDPKIELVINDEEVNQLTIDYDATSHGNQNNNVNVSTTESDTDSEVTYNYESDSPPIMVKDRIRKTNVRDLMKSRILVWSSDSNDEKDRTDSSESNCDGDDEVDDNEDKEEILPSSANLCKYIPTNNQWGQINHVNRQLAIMNTTSPSGKLPETQNISLPNQEAFQKSESINSLEDMHDLKQSSSIKYGTQSSEESCY